MAWEGCPSLSGCCFVWRLGDEEDGVTIDNWYLYVATCLLQWTNDGVCGAAAIKVAFVVRLEIYCRAKCGGCRAGVFWDLFSPLLLL